MRFITKLIQPQKGMALVLVMIMMGLGSIMVVPLMMGMSSGLKDIRMYDNQTGLHYAADSGIQKGLWKISTYTNAPAQNFAENLPVYTLNGKSVTATVLYTWALEGIPGADPNNGTTPHDDFLGLGGSTSSRVEYDTSTNPPRSIYTITYVTGGGFSNKKASYIGAWLPLGFNYVPGSCDLFANNITRNEPVIEFVHRGNSISWYRQSGWQLNDNTVYTQKFLVTPVNKFPKGDIAWIRGHDQSVGLSWDASIWNYAVTATATDSGRSTQIIAHVTRDNGTSGGLGIITYDLQ
jgi:hypothetical protein